MAFVYVSNAASGEASVLHMAADGELHVLPPCLIGGNVAPMAVNTQHAMLYVAQRGQANAVVSLSMDATSGALVHQATTPLSAKMSYLALDRSASFLMAASYHSHHVSVLALGADGLPVGDEQQVSTPLHPHCVVMTPSNRYALVACLGADVLQVHDFDASTGHLSASPSVEWRTRAQSGPRHLRFSPSGLYVYLLNELDASLDVLAWDEQRLQLRHVQTLSTLPPGFGDKPWAAEVHLTPDGQFLMTTERRSSTLALFRVDGDAGTLTLVGHTLVEAQPRAFAVTPDGQQVLVAGQLSHHLARYRFDANAGRLQLTQRLPIGQEPLWIEIVG